MPEKDSLVANHAWAEGVVGVDEPHIPMRCRQCGVGVEGRRGAEWLGCFVGALGTDATALLLISHWGKVWLHQRRLMPSLCHIIRDTKSLFWWLHLAGRFTRDSSRDETATLTAIFQMLVQGGERCLGPCLTLVLGPAIPPMLLTAAYSQFTS